MARPDILPRLRAIFKEQLDLDHDDVNKINESDKIEDVLDEGDADSLDSIDIQTAIEEEFGIEIPDEACDGFSTIGDVVNFIEKERGE